MAKKKNNKQDLLYIMSNSCGWCKKSQPIVDELVSEGAKITTLDVMNPDDQKRANEVKQKYNAQCGTPFFIDAESGNQICGFREKDIIQKWVNGEEIPKPPQPKSPPPPPPTDFDDAKQISEWKEKYEKWSKENDHLPKILPADDVLQRMKQARERQAQQGAPNPGNVPQSNNQNPSVVKNTQFYYIVENGNREAVMADSNFINGLKQQYYVRESDGKLSKVIGDNTWNKNQPQQQNPSLQPVKSQPPKNVAKQVKAQIDKVKKDGKVKKEATNKKSKENKKTIKGL